MDTSRLNSVISQSINEHTLARSLSDAMIPMKDACQSHVFRSYLNSAKENKNIPTFSINVDLHSPSIEDTLGDSTQNVRLFLASVEKAIKLNSQIQFTDRQKFLLASTFTIGTAKQLLIDCAVKNEFDWHSLKKSFINYTEPIPPPPSIVMAKLLAIKWKPSESLLSLYLRCKQMRELLLYSLETNDTAGINTIVADHFSLCVSKKFNRRLSADSKTDLSHVLDLAVEFCYKEGIMIPDPNELTDQITPVLHDPCSTHKPTPCNHDSGKNHAILPSKCQNIAVDTSDNSRQTPYSDIMPQPVNTSIVLGSPQAIPFSLPRHMRRHNGSGHERRRPKQRQRKRRRCYKCGIYGQHLAKFCNVLNYGNSYFRFSPIAPLMVMHLDFFLRIRII